MRRNTSAGHLSIAIQAGTTFVSERGRARLPMAIAASAALDILLAALFVFASHNRQQKATTTPPDSSSTADRHFIFLSDPGPGGGGGGGGNRMKDPPRQAASPGHDTITVPVRRPPAPEPSQQVRNEPNPLEGLDIPVKDLSSAQELIPGTIEAPGPPSPSQGSGSHGGAGTGDGGGDGAGKGPGFGPGTDGGFGGGPNRGGTDVMRPVLVREVKPAYTSDAMRARLQGSVFLECVVRPDGSVSDVTILRSLDSMFGLDLEAVKAARQWRFQPATRRGEPVAMRITIQLDFSLR